MVWVLAGLLVLDIVFTIVGIISDVHKGAGIKLAMKNAINPHGFMLGIIGGMYLLVIALMPLSSINEWVDHIVGLQDSLLPVIVLKLAPSIYCIFVVIAYVRVIRWGFRPIFAYTENEKVWKKQERDKFRAKIAPHLPIWVQNKWKA